MPFPYRKVTAFSRWNRALDHHQNLFYALSFCCKDVISFVQPLPSVLPELPAVFVEEGTSDGEEEHGDPMTASLLISMCPNRSLVQEEPAWSKGAWMAFCRAWMDHGAARHIHTSVFWWGWSGAGCYTWPKTGEHLDHGGWLCVGLHLMEKTILCTIPDSICGEDCVLATEQLLTCWRPLSAYANPPKLIPKSSIILPWVHWQVSNKVLRAANPWFTVSLYSLAGCLRGISFNKQ